MQSKSFQLNDGRRTLRIPMKKRLIIGSGDTADIQLSQGKVMSIHCLLENIGGAWKIYNLAPKSILRVNGKDVVTSMLSKGDEIIIGQRVFKFEELAEVEGKELKKVLPPIFTESYRKPLPTMPNLEKTIAEDKIGFRKNHPLILTKDFNFNEYIFEDSEEVYPIFKYDMSKEAVEVVVLFRNKILSIDYIPCNDGTYYLTGSSDKLSDVEFAYLGKKEKIPLVDIKGSEMFLHNVPGFEHRKFGDENSNDMMLGKDDVHLFENGDLQLFIRGDKAPPFIKHAPVLRRDSEFKKYLILCLLFVSTFVGVFSMYEVDTELEKEKIPQRIATILYKPKELRISKDREVVKEIVKDKPELKKTPVKPEVVVKETAKKPQKSLGDLKSKPNESTPNKATPKKGPKNDIRKVTDSSKQAGKPGKTSKATVRKANNSNQKFKGNVDTYKSVDFSSSISNLMAKGGSLNAASNNVGNSVSFKDSNALSTNESAQIEKANVDSNVGSLSSKTKGQLESSFGTDGLVKEKQVYIAGVPYKEVILGSIDRNDIYRILLENVPQFQYCHQRELDVRQSALEGVVVLNFVIGPSGHVTRASATNNGNSLPASTKNCIVSHLKTIQFPQPKGGGEVAVTTPLNLQSKQM